MHPVDRRRRHEKREHELVRNTGEFFRGFPHITGNFLYCPNQFFDVCVPHSSRGVVRLVAYILDKTLGWLGRDGNPISQDITISYGQLVESAGISRGAVRQALDDAIDARFIRCVTEGKPSAAGQSAERASYALQWDGGDDYGDTPETFQGFFSGVGHRTPIPNAFFRNVIPHEALTVMKVVGAVLRHTVGYQNQFGDRRSEAPLSYRFLQTYANIPDPRSVSSAISSAIASQYIVRVEEGSFHSNPAKRKPSTYAINWLTDERLLVSGSKNPVDDRFKKASKVLVQKTQHERSTNPSSHGSKKPAGDRFKKASKEKTPLKHTSKQQQVHLVAAAVSLGQGNGYTLLVAAGFDQAIALRLAQTATRDEIARQIEWLPRRNAKRNQLGMLRKAIEDRWAEPPASPIFKSKMPMLERDQQHSDINVAAESQKRERLLRRDTLLAEWRQLPLSRRVLFHNQSIEQSASETVRRRLRRHRDMDVPPNEVLDMMSQSLSPSHI